MAKPFDPERVWFTSDMHFGHKNILKYCPDRPYKDIEEMRLDMIEVWNKTVTPADFVFVLGDVSFQKSKEEIVSTIGQLNGQLHLIKGNHDHKKHLKIFKEHNLFQWIGDYREIRVLEPDNPHGWQRICMFHFPVLIWHGAHRDSWMLHGHSHGTCDVDQSAKRVDVGWDMWGQPVSYRTLKGYFKDFSFEPRDTHGRQD